MQHTLQSAPRESPTAIPSSSCSPCRGVQTPTTQGKPHTRVGEVHAHCRSRSKDQGSRSTRSRAAGQTSVCVCDSTQWLTHACVPGHAGAMCASGARACAASCSARFPCRMASAATAAVVCSIGLAARQRHKLWQTSGVSGLVSRALFGKARSEQQPCVDPSCQPGRWRLERMSKAIGSRSRSSSSSDFGGKPLTLTHKKARRRHLSRTSRQGPWGSRTNQRRACGMHMHACPAVVCQASGGTGTPPPVHGNAPVCSSGDSQRRDSESESSRVSSLHTHGSEVAA